MSPPTRDTDPLKQPQAPLDPQQQQMAEICHQRQEIEEAVRKIRAIKQKADATNTTGELKPFSCAVRHNVKWLNILML